MLTQVNGLINEESIMQQPPAYLNNSNLACAFKQGGWVNSLLQDGLTAIGEGKQLIGGFAHVESNSFPD